MTPPQTVIRFPAAFFRRNRKMYYYTKEWYLRSRCTGLHLYLQHCSEQEARSSEYYEKLFALYAEDVRFECEQIKNTSYDVFIEDRTEDEDFLTEEFVMWKINNDPAEAEFYAAGRIAERIERLKTILPREIISRIPDIRIFALNHADGATIEMITGYAEECRRFAAETDFRFEEEYPARTEPIPAEIWEEYGFKGGRIKKLLRKGRDVIIYIDNAGSGSDVTAMYLEDADVQRLDDGLDGAEWIYNELYLINGEYEVCALCKNGNEFPEFILHTKKLYFDFDR